MIMYTSGTTAAPKGVVLLQKNLATAVNAHAERLQLKLLLNTVTVIFLGFFFCLLS